MEKLLLALAIVLNLNCATAEETPVPDLSVGTPPTRISLGVGTNYLENSQSVSSPYTSDLKYESFRGPSLQLQIDKYFTAKWGAQVSFLNLVGKSTSSPTAVVDSDQYNWLLVNANALYAPEAFRDIFGVYNGVFLFGLLHTNIPFIRRTAPTTVKVSSINVTLANLGLLLEEKCDTDCAFSHSLSAGVQTEIFSESEVDIKNMYGLFLNAQWNYHLRKDIFLGVSPQVQYLTFKFSKIVDAPTAQAMDGKQDMLSLNLFFNVMYLL